MGIFIRHERLYLIASTQELAMNVFQKLRKFATDRRAARALDALDDRTLQDLGISRSHIRVAVAHGTR